MHEPQTKQITRFGLTITGLDVYFPKKGNRYKNWEDVAPDESGH